MPNHTDQNNWHGFSLQNISWGYRELYRKRIETLFDEKLIGTTEKETTKRFFALLKQATQGRNDHILKRFLDALTPGNYWLFHLPDTFSDITTFGMELAKENPHLATTYFKILGNGNLGATPEEIRNALDLGRRLKQRNAKLAVAFLKGLHKLRERLRKQEIENFAQSGLKIYERNLQAALNFFEIKTTGAENSIRALSSEACLDDEKPALETFVHALTGQEIHITNLEKLDSDNRIECGSTTVFLGHHLYLPTHGRWAMGKRRNQSWYKLAGLCAAAQFNFDGFSKIHGHPEFPNLPALGKTRLDTNLIYLLEWLRIFRGTRKIWPGMTHLLHSWLDAESASNSTAALLLTLLDGKNGSLARQLAKHARQSQNIFSTADRIDDKLRSSARAELAELGSTPLPPVSFLPDAFFPASFNQNATEDLILDLRQKSRQRSEEEEEKTEAQTKTDSDNGIPSEKEGLAPQACFAYDEWSRELGSYLTNHCLLHEIPPGDCQNLVPPADIMAEGRRISQIFERLRPDEVRREKHLENGDSINPDQLLTHLVRRRVEPLPPTNFYERPRIQQRDPAILILLDISGSTGEPAGDNRQILDIEKHAALILGQGLHTLDDRFAICGFHSNGRKNCRYSVYKDFDTTWSPRTMSQILAASPAGSTRIGPALRHSAWKMEKIPARNRLILLITDGRPLDAGYDPNTRYAQYDVRVACEENKAKGIHTFAITTRENSLTDMRIMFPNDRFRILPDIHSLPKILPTLYTQLTF